MRENRAEFDVSDRINAVAIEEETAPPQELEQERRVAIYDLTEENSFHFDGAPGPYRLTLSRVTADAGGYRLTLEGQGSAAPEVIELSDPALIEASTEYLAVCAMYRDAVRRLPPAQIEAADAERRALHGEAAELLRAALAPRARLDEQTARRLFTLCCTFDAGMEKLL